MSALGSSTRQGKSDDSAKSLYYNEHNGGLNSTSALIGKHRMKAELETNETVNQFGHARNIIADSATQGGETHNNKLINRTKHIINPTIS